MSSHVSKGFGLVRGNRGNQGKELQAELEKWEADEFNEAMEEWMNEDYGWDDEYWQGEESFFDDDERSLTSDLDAEHDLLDEARAQRQQGEHDAVWSAYSKEASPTVRDVAFASIATQEPKKGEFSTQQVRTSYRRWGINE